MVTGCSCWEGPHQPLKSVLSSGGKNKAERCPQGPTHGIFSNPLGSYHKGLYFSSSVRWLFLVTQTEEEIVSATEMVWHISVKTTWVKHWLHFPVCQKNQLVEWFKPSSLSILGKPMLRKDRSCCLTWVFLHTVIIWEKWIFLFFDRFHDSSKGKGTAVTSSQSSCVRTSVVLWKSQGKLLGKNTKLS